MPSASLGIPLRETIHHFPFWHREEPVLATIRIDPEFAGLRAQFPQTWKHLVRAKLVLDSITTLDVPAVNGDDKEHAERVSGLLTAAAAALTRFADEEQAPTTRTVVEHARQAAERLVVYADSREWKQVTLLEPNGDEPWLYCGPIGTWAMRDVDAPISLLVTVPCPQLQTEVDAVDERIGDIQEAAARALGEKVKSVQDIHPTMYIMELLLAGGESVTGHKNFAHFFPLEAAESTVLGPEFTVVFANVHRERMRRCSLPLLQGVQGGQDGVLLDEALRMSLRWFRCHDLGHFWRRASVEGAGEAPAEISYFERMALEEAYADVLGLLTAGAVGPDDRLGTAFTAELVRYLSRRYHHFADSAAAMLTLGWIQEHAAEVDFPLTDDFIGASREALTDLAKALHSVLWDADTTEIARLRGALDRGRTYRDSLARHFDRLPTDLTYNFG
ncbi:hypothetical protein ACGF7W_26230 [Streptomyces sp. NPDC048219]|uniref:hypothetical protein n=1 Tax=Streptomyces sp. NPDC048219 TaxID=3365517 RepID=UPI00371F8529